MYALNLIENGTVETIDTGACLAELIETQVECGWEDDAHRLPSSHLTITEQSTGNVVAILAWAPEFGQEWPLLRVIDVATGDVGTYRRVERQPVYGYELVS